MSKWIDFVKSFADKHKLSYRDALCSPKCKEEYSKMKSGKGITQSRVNPTDDIDSSEDSMVTQYRQPFDDKRTMTNYLVGRPQKEIRVLQRDIQNRIDTLEAEAEETRIREIQARNRRNAQEEQLRRNANMTTVPHIRDNVRTNVGFPFKK